MSDKGIISITPNFEFDECVISQSAHTTDSVTQLYRAARNPCFAGVYCKNRYKKITFLHHMD